MGFGGISVWQLLILLAIVVLLFGTSKLRSLGGDLGAAVKSFRSGIKEGEQGDTGDAAASDSTSAEPGDDDASKR